MLHAFFWVIARRLNFICQRFRTLCLFHLHRQVGMKNSSYLRAYEDGAASYLPAYEDGTDSVLKRWHIKFRRRRIIQKKG